MVFKIEVLALDGASVDAIRKGVDDAKENEVDDEVVVSTIEFPREPDCQKRIRGEEWMLVDARG